MQHAVQQLEPQVPPNPNQVEERADVREWEERYQERLRQRRQQQLPEAVLMQQHPAVSAAGAAHGSGWQVQQQQQQQDRGSVSSPGWQQLPVQRPEAEDGEEQLTVASIGSSAVVQLSRRQQRQGYEWVWWRLLTAGYAQQQHQQHQQQQQQQPGQKQVL
jgi:hypothetical protein